MTDLKNAGASIDMRSFQGKTLRQSYYLNQYIQEGNFGAVYRSEQQFFGSPARRVAVKLSKHAGITTQTARDIFSDAFLLAKVMDEITDALARSYLVHVYDMGIAHEWEDRAYLVMEFVQGTTLAAQFDSYKGRVPANLLLKWARQICHALKELHALIPPVIHRDLKPDNILLGVDRNVRVVDFGLAAKLLHNGYVPGVAGTIDYMAPETTRGESVPASDVYSVGLILYKGLTGRLPFEHLIPPLNQPDALHSDWLYKQKGRLIPTPPAHLNNSVTSELSDTIMRCLEFRPSQRFFDAGELLDALEEKEQEEPPDVRALTEGRQMKGAGELQEARLMFERGLGAASGSTPTRFHLLCELGEVLLRMGDHKAAAARLADAWALVKDTGILSRLQERIDLLGRIAAAYSGCGNSYQAGIYERLKSEELKKMRL